MGRGHSSSSGDGQERVALVVAQPDVEARPVPLDERVLEHQRFDVVANLDPLDRLGGRAPSGRSGAAGRRVLEVVREPRAQGLGLADVDHPAVGVLELVGARGVGDGAGGRALDHCAMLMPHAVADRSAITPASRSVGCYSHAGLVSGDISVPGPTTPWRGDQAVPTVRQPERHPTGGSTHAAAPDTAPRALHGDVRRRARRADRRRPRPRSATGVFILGHHYQRDEVMRWADARGDSYRLSVLAQERPEAEYIVFCGVHFMAESADVLTADHQQVILPDLNAGCSMADMADIDEVEEAWEELAGVTDIDRRRADHLHELVGRPEGVRRAGTAARCARRPTPGPVLEWALGREAGGRQVLFFPDQHLGRNTGLAMGYTRRRHAGVEPAARARRAHRGRRARRPRSCCGRATARCTSGSAPSTSTRSAPSTPTASSIAHPECAHERVRARRPGRLDRLHHPGGRGGARRLGHRASAPRSTSSTAGRRDPGQDRRVARPAGLPVLDHVPHRRARTWRGCSRTWSRARSSTGSPSTPTPPSGPGSRSSACSTSRPQQRATKRFTC